MTQNILIALAAYVVVLGLVSMYRTFMGPTVYDRLVGVGVISTKALVVLCLIGLIYGRFGMFVDIAVAYAMLNFISNIAIARYLEDQHLDTVASGADPAAEGARP